MARKLLICLPLTIILLTASLAHAQQLKKVPRIGFVTAVGDANAPGPLVEAFRQGLRDLGYIEGKNILVEFRYAEGKADRMPSLVNELVRLNVDVLVVPTLDAVHAARQATKTVPIVMVISDDPVATGLVDSLAHPGGNITGLTRLQRELSGKRLELLKEAVSHISRVAVLRDADSQTAGIGFKEYEAAAHPLRVQLESLAVRGPKPDLESALQNTANGRVNALVTITSTLLFFRQKEIADLAIRNRLPSMFEGSTWVEAGGLISYSTNDREVFRRIATYIDKILKGAKPGDLPVEQPTNFELVINLKTAKQIGLTIPQSVLYRADKLIK